MLNVKPYYAPQNNWSSNDYYSLPEVTDIIAKLEWITDNSYSNIIRIEYLVLHLTLSPKRGIIQKNYQQSFARIYFYDTGGQSLFTVFTSGTHNCALLTFMVVSSSE